MSDTTVLPRTAPTERRMLPVRLELPHAVAFNFLDQVTALVHFLDQAGELSLSVELRPGEEAEFESLTGEELWDWLLEHGHEDVVREMSRRHVSAALIADLSHFMFEALVTAANGKATVAFALLRKPLKENLALLEWLLCDSDGFLDAFHGDVPSVYAWRTLSEERQRALIAESLERIGTPVLDAEFIYDVRYSKTCEYGLERLWQKATHLVTTMKGLETEPTNLNFVFSRASDIDDQLDMFYLVVPPLLLYALSVAESVVGRFVRLDGDRQAVRRLLRALAIARHSEAISGPVDSSDALCELLDVIRPLWDAECSECNLSIELEGDNVDRLWSAAEIACPGCGDTLDVWGAIFPEETRGPELGGQGDDSA